jgi:hypothetical protein
MGISIRDLLLVLPLLALYFVPYIVARSRKHPQVTPILILNLFFGWTLIGWVGALVWACLKSPTQREAVAIDEPTRACPYCAERIKVQAKVCRFCGGDLPDHAASAA